MKYSIVLLAAGLCCVYAMGCDPELSESIDNVVSNAPEVCQSYCNKKFKCEWYAEGDLKDDAEDDAKERCEVSCAWQLNNGAYLVKTVQEEGQTIHKYKDHVSSAKVRDFMECLWDKDLFNCVEFELTGESYFRLELEDEDNCDKMRKCQKEMENDDLTKYKWESGVCALEDLEPVELELFI